MILARAISMILILFAVAGYSHAQQLLNRGGENYRAIHWDIEDGLSEAETYFMLKDAEGFLWIGTGRGLNRFDGSTFKTYYNSPANKNSLLNNQAYYGLVEDSLHNIWVGVGGGLSRYNRNSESFTNILPDDSIPIQSNYSGWALIPFWATKDEVLCVEHETTVVAYNIRSLKKRILGNIRPYEKYYNALPFAYSAFDVVSNSVWMIVEGQRGTGLLQLSLNDGSKKYFTWPCFKNIPSHDHWTEAMRYDPYSGSIWINSPDGLLEFTIKDKQFHPVEAMKQLVQLKDYNRWVGIDLDAQGRVWFATRPDGILVYDPASKEITQPFKDSYTAKEAAESNACIYCDKDGIVWSGFWSTKGFYQLTPFAPAITRFTAQPIKHDSLSSNAVWGIIKGNEGKMWLGSDRGLDIFDPVTNTFKLESEMFSFRPFRSIIPILADASAKKAWIFVDVNLYEIDLTTRKCRLVLFRDSLNNIIEAVGKPVPYKHGCIAPGVYGDDELGFFMVTGDSAVGKEILHFPKRTIDNFYTDGNLLFLRRGNYPTNLTYSNSNGKWTQTPNPLDNIHWNRIIYNPHDQTYWVICYQQLLHYSKNFELIRAYTSKDGIPEIDIYEGVTDNNDNFWFHTDRALYWLEVKTGKIRKLSKAEGFQKQNYAPISGAAIDNNGDLYFPGGVFGLGVDRISPDKIIKKYPPSAVYVKSVEINQQPFSLQTEGDSSLKLSLKYFQNKISIETGVIDFFSQGKTSIRYKLESINDNWQYAPAYYTIRYDGLQPGNYKLLVQASNADNEFNGPTKIISITITPAVWNTWWFRTIAAILVLASLYGLIRYRMHQKFRLHLERSEKEKQLAMLQQKTSELETKTLRSEMEQVLKLQEMRTRIASDLHDDIGSTLTSISYYSELVKMQLKEDNARLKPMLDKIGGSARNTINAMSDIVWIINPKNDTTANLVSRMKYYAAEMLGERNIQYNFNTNEAIEKTELNMQQRKNLYLIYKEAIHNAVKYAQCSSMEIDFLQTDHQLSLSIHDHGKGFDLQDANEGNGLINMKKRAEEINAAFEICSYQNKGTQIKLTCKIT